MTTMIQSTHLHQAKPQVKRKRGQPDMSSASSSSRDVWQHRESKAKQSKRKGGEGKVGGAKENKGQRRAGKGGDKGKARRRKKAIEEGTYSSPNSWA